MASIDLSVVLSGNSSLTPRGVASYAAAVTFPGGSSITPRAGVRWAEHLSLHASSGFVTRAGVKWTVRSTFHGSSAISATSTVSLGVQSPIRYQPASRTVNVSKLVLDQVDLFRVDGKTRAQGVTVADLNLKLFFNGSQVDWPLVSGSSTQDLQVTAGQIYWTEFLAGFYTIRFFPNVVGSWRILLTYPAFDEAVSLSYDVALPTFVPVSSGIRTSFIKR